MKAKSIVFAAPNKAVIEEKKIEEPTGKQVLVRTIKSLISTGTELARLTGIGRNVQYPFIPGYCNIGTVEKIGEQVKLFKIGDVVASWGNHTSHFLIDESKLEKVPEEINPEEAAFFTIGQIVLNGVRLAHITLGESIVIIGAGILGQLAIQVSKISGGFPVICIDISEKRLEIAKKSGADFAFNVQGEEAKKQVEEITRGRMADVVLEVTGNPEVIPWSLKLSRKFGRYILLGTPRGTIQTDSYSEIHLSALQVFGAINEHPQFETPYNPWTLHRDAELFFELLLAKKIDVKFLISDIFSYKDAPGVYEMLLKDRSQKMGVIFDWE